MDSDTKAIVKLDELELGLYRRGNEICVYLNQGQVCIFRQIVELVPELGGVEGKVVNLETLRRLNKMVRVT